MSLRGSCLFVIFTAAPRLVALFPEAERTLRGEACNPGKRTTEGQGTLRAREILRAPQLLSGPKNLVLKTRTYT